MRSFQQVVVFLFALFAFALAQSEPADYDTTVYVTSTVYRVSSITLSGTPTGSVENSTSTIYSTMSAPEVTSVAAVTPIYSAGPSNGTTVAPTGAPSGSLSPSPSQPVDFPGAASHFSVNALVALVAVGAGFLAL